MWRPLAILSLGLVVVGASVVAGSFVLGAYNHGSCPLATPTTPPCDHTLTIGGTTIWIGKTAQELFTTGVAVLIAGLAVRIYDSRANRSPERTTVAP